MNGGGELLVVMMGAVSSMLMLATLAEGFR
jgi:hypothetical protein